MARIVAILVILFAAPSAVADDRALRKAGPELPPAKEGYSYPECYCTDSDGRRVEVGGFACLTIGSRQVTSRCTKARNLVIWRHQQEGCAPGV